MANGSWRGQAPRDGGEAAASRTEQVTQGPASRMRGGRAVRQQQGRGVAHVGGGRDEGTANTRGAGRSQIYLSGVARRVRKPLGWTER
eukprot:COSAG01_NODE_15896_length_1287_cov_2.852694_3_plen_88_part_00